MSTALAQGAGDAGASTSTTSTANTGGSTGGTTQTTTQTTGQTSQTGSAMSSGTGTTQSWRDTLPEDLKGNPILAKYSDVPNLAKALLSAQEMIGKKGVIKPAPNATQEDWKAFKEALGVPPVDKYDVPQPKGFEFPKETMDWAKKTFAEIGILPEDAAALMHKYAEFETAREKSIASAKKEASDKGIQALQKEWGENYAPELKRGLFAFQKIAEMAGIDKNSAMQWMDKELGNDANFIKIMSAASKLFREDTLRENGLGSGAVSASELDAQIEEYRGQLMTMTKQDPRRPGVLAKFESLSRQRTGGR